MGYITKTFQISTLLCIYQVCNADSIKPQNDAMNLFLDESCNKNVVLLGEESNHGSGETIILKTKLVKELIEKCGFSAVFFESSVYEFVNLKNSLNKKIATKAQLANSIGGLWSFAQETDDLIDYLFKKTQEGTVQLAGLDLQVGSVTGIFTQNKLASNLTKYILTKYKQSCEQRLFRHFNWQYDEVNQYNKEAQLNLLNCSDEISKSLVSQNASTEKQQLTLFALNFKNYLAMKKGDSFNIRSKQMYDNFLSHYSKMAHNSKVIIWTATIHSLKDASPISEKIKPLGTYIHENFGDKAFAIGISAKSGNYYNRFQKESVQIEQKPDSLEGITKIVKKYTYLNTEKLKSLGNISSNVISYSKPYSVKWHQLLDAIIIIKKEQSPHYIYPKKAR